MQKSLPILTLLLFSQLVLAVIPRGKLLSLDKSTGQYIALNSDCSLQVGKPKQYVDRDHGSPRSVVEFEYKLIGFPDDVKKYSSGSAIGSDYGNINSAQEVFEPGFWAGMKGERVSINFSIPNVQSSTFILNPKFTEVLAIRDNPTKSYFGGDDVKWAYACRF